MKTFKATLRSFSTPMDQLITLINNEKPRATFMHFAIFTNLKQLSLELPMRELILQTYLCWYPDGGCPSPCYESRNY